MISKFFFERSLMGVEWILYLLIGLSFLSIGILLERFFFYKKVQKGIVEFRLKLRTALSTGNFAIAIQIVEARKALQSGEKSDLETEMAFLLLSHREEKREVLEYLAEDARLRARGLWERSLTGLATIGSNTPFIGLFGTVLGIIRAFHDLGIHNGAQTISSGISEALVATAIGLWVAIPAIVGFNLFQRKLRCAWVESESLKNFILSQLKKESRHG